MGAHDDPPLSPARALALLRDQQREVAARAAALVPAILAVWGAAWLAGFLVLWADASRHPDDWRPGATAVLLCAALLAAAGALSGLLSARSARGLRGTRTAATIGIAYGCTWWIGGAALLVIGWALVRFGMPEGLLAVLHPAAFHLFAGLMYLAGALIWRAAPMAVLGTWCVVLSAVGALVPPPGNHLLYGLAGGGAFLLVAAWSAWRHSRQRRPQERDHG